MSVARERIASATLHIGDCLDVLPRLAADGFRAHAVVTDPPYGLEFMGVAWDTFSDRPKGRARPRNEWNDFGSREHARNASEQAGIARKKNLSFQEFSAAWAREVYACMLPGAHLVAFGGTRTQHRMVCAIEDAGFEIRDTLMWVYGSGFPKSLDVGKAIDKAAGAEREVVGQRDRYLDGGNRRNLGNVNNWGGTFGTNGVADITAPATPEAAAWAGWHTALKPGYEPIILARKPLSEGNVAANVLRHGCGAINVDACRVPASDKTPAPVGQYGGSAIGPTGHSGERNGSADTLGRWPANLLHDGSPEVEQAFAAFGERAGAVGMQQHASGTNNVMGKFNRSDMSTGGAGISDTGSASRFFYTAKADARDRAGSRHPTVKPASLMRWLVRLVTPPGGTILDPFAGTGSTGLAADQCGMRSVLIERDPTYAGDALRKIREDAPLFAEASSDLDAAYQRHGDLFADAAD